MAKSDFRIVAHPIQEPKSDVFLNLTTSAILFSTKPFSQTDAKTREKYAAFFLQCNLRPYPKNPP